MNLTNGQNFCTNLFSDQSVCQNSFAQWSLTWLLMYSTARRLLVLVRM